MNTSSGKSVFSVLLFQDLAVIPILAVLTLLATAVMHDKGHHKSVLFDIGSLPGYMQISVTLLAILSIFLAGKFASRPIFRTIAATRVREIFVAAALALVVGISLLMTAVGLSPALGTFLAGVVLAYSEYRHELESDIEPFKGLLLGIFFISIVLVRKTRKSGAIQTRLIVLDTRSSLLDLAVSGQTLVVFLFQPESSRLFSIMMRPMWMF